MKEQVIIQEEDKREVAAERLLRLVQMKELLLSPVASDAHSYGDGKRASSCGGGGGSCGSCGNCSHVRRD